MNIKGWFLSKIESKYSGGFIEEINGVVRESEKAVLVSITIGYTSSLQPRA